jgi:hypothetical protein
MGSISITYHYKYRIDFAPEYVFSGKRCFNLKRGKEIKKVLHGYTLGFNIKGKFYSLAYLRTHLVKIEQLTPW